MDWNNVNFLSVEEGVEGSGNYFVHPQSGAMMSSDNMVDVIPMEQESNVVFRTLEGLSAGGAGVEVIGFLEEGQQTMHLVEGMNSLPVGITEEEILAQLQAHQQTIVDTDHGGIASRHQDRQQNVVADHVVAMESIQETQVDSGQSVVGRFEGRTPSSALSTVTVEESLGSEPALISNTTRKEEASGSVAPLNTPLAGEKMVTNDHQVEGGAHQESSKQSLQHPSLENGPEGGPTESREGRVEDPGTIDQKGKEPVVSDPGAEASSRTPVDEVKPSDQSDALNTPTKDAAFKVPQSPLPASASSTQSSVVDSKPSAKPPVTVFETVPECPKEEPIIIEITDDDDDDGDEGLLDDFPEEEDDIICISSDEDDEVYKVQVENAKAMQRVKQSVDATAAIYRPRFVSREKLGRRHPRCKDLTFTAIMKQAIGEDKILPDFNEQIIPRKIADKLRITGHSLHKAADGGFMVSSRKRNVKCYHSSFSARFEPVLADPVLENYVQEYRKILEAGMWRKRLYGRKEVDPSSVIPASVGSTGSSSIGSETDPECLATDEDESESELMQGSVAAWIIPDAIESRTPSPEPDFDEPQFITTQVGSHAVVEGPPAKKRKQKHHEPKPHTDGKIYPKPAFSYSCLIAMALKNSKTGSLPVSEIYKFMCDHFPYFKSAPSGWKNSVRHNLSLNKCFEKIEKPGNNGARKGCLWALNPAKIHKMDEEVQKWSRKDPLAIRRAMSDPENLELIERGELKRDYSGAGASDDDEDEDFSEPATPLTPSQAQARRSRTNSSDSTVEGTTTVVTPVVTTVSQVHAALQRSIESKTQIQVKREDAVELGTITNIQGNYVCHTPNGNGTYTLSFANIGSSSPLTPIIIRRTPTVK